MVRIEGNEIQIGIATARPANDLDSADAGGREEHDLDTPDPLLRCVAVNDAGTAVLADQDRSPAAGEAKLAAAQCGQRPQGAPLTLPAIRPGRAAGTALAKMLALVVDGMTTNQLAARA